MAYDIVELSTNPLTGRGSASYGRVVNDERGVCR